MDGHFIELLVAPTSLDIVLVPCSCMACTACEESFGAGGTGLTIQTTAQRFTCPWVWNL